MELSDGAILALIGFGGGALLGLSARIGRFCTLGAIEDALYGGDFRRLRMWSLALGLCIISFALAETYGYASAETSIYANAAWNPAASIFGGLVFGYGMALAGNCGFGALSRLGGGDLRSFVVVIVMGVSAYMTIGGPFGALRVMVFPPEATSGDPTEWSIAHALSALLGSPVLAISLALGFMFCAIAFANADFRKSPKHIFWAVVVAIAVMSGWVGTTWMVENSFEDITAGSHTYTAPVGETLIYLMTSTGGGLSFGIGSVAGVLVGAFVGSFQRGHFRWEACDDPRELGRQIFGAILMGIGAVTALGCSLGQGLAAFSTTAYSAPVTLMAIFVGAALGLRQLIHGFARQG